MLHRCPHCFTWVRFTADECPSCHKVSKSSERLAQGEKAPAHGLEAPRLDAPKPRDAVREIAQSHKFLRDTVLFLFCAVIFFLSTLSDQPALAENRKFASLAVGLALLVLPFLLWPLAFRLYPRAKAMGICFLSLLTITLPFVFFFVDRKAVQYLRAQGLNPSWLDLFEFPKLK
jgi:hypothetical protein